MVLPNGKMLPQIGRIAGGGYEFDPNTQAMEVMVDSQIQVFCFDPDWPLHCRRERSPIDEADRYSPSPAKAPLPFAIK